MPKKHTHAWYAEQVSALYKRDKKLRVLQQELEAAADLEFNLPAGVLEDQWIRKIVDLSPYNYLRGGTRALANLDERITIEPVSVLKGLDDTEDTDLSARQKANEWEKTIKWQFLLLAERDGKFRSDVVRSALLFDEVVGQVVHLPSQIKIIEDRGGSARRQKAARRHGDFAIILENPRCVHTRYSRYMLEEVVCVKVRDPQDIVDFWGKDAAKIAAAIEADDAPESYVEIEYCSFDRRYVYAVPGDNEEQALEAKDKDVVVLLDEENPYPFLSWVAVAGGTNLSDKPENQRLSVLHPIVKTDHWKTVTVVHTLMVSKALANMAKPDRVITGPTAKDEDVDHTEVDGVARMNPGNQMADLRPPIMDPALDGLRQFLEGKMNDAALAKILVSAEAGAQETFAGFQLRLSTGMGSIMPYKYVAESFENQCVKTMLYWAHYTETDINGYGKERDPEDGKKKSRKYTIKWNDIDPNCLYTRVALTPDVPLDRQQKINSAIQLAQTLPVSFNWIMEFLDEVDPEGIFDEWMLEQMIKAAHQGNVDLIKADASGQLMQIAQQLAQQMLQQQMAQVQQQQMGGGEQGQGMPGPINGQPMAPQPGTMGIPGAEGQGVNPAAGGIPPAMMNPGGGTFEQQQGMTRGGQPF